MWLMGMRQTTPTWDVAGLSHRASFAGQYLSVLRPGRRTDPWVIWQVPWEHRPNRVTSAMWRFETGAVGTFTHTITQHEKIYLTSMEVCSVHAVATVSGCLCHLLKQPSNLTCAASGITSHLINADSSWNGV